MNPTRIFMAAFFALGALSAQADSQAKQFERYTPDKQSCAEIYTHYDFDKVVAETKTNAVVRQDAGISCAAGNFFLMNKKRKTYAPIDPGVCDDRGFSVKIEGDRLIFRSGKRITALYPLYE